MLLRPFLRPSTHTTSSIINLLHAPSTPIRTLRTFAHPSSRIAARLAPTPATQQHPLLLTTIALTTLSTPFLARTTIYNDGPLADFSSTASNEAKSPLSKDGGKNLSPTVVRQMSMGALCGLGLGVVVSAFSKMIVLVVGLGIVIVQYAARRGIRLIPEGTLQRYVRGINVRGMINENAAFKISFGLMFAMTAFGHI